MHRLHAVCRSHRSAEGRHRPRMGDGRAVSCLRAVTQLRRVRPSAAPADGRHAIVAPLRGRTDRKRQLMTAEAFCVAREFEPSGPLPFVTDRHYLLYALEGLLRLEADGRRWTLPPARAALIRAGQPILVTVLSRLRSASVLFDPAFMAQRPIRTFSLRHVPAGARTRARVPAVQQRNAATRPLRRKALRYARRGHSQARRLADALRHAFADVTRARSRHGADRGARRKRADLRTNRLRCRTVATCPGPPFFD